MPNQLSDVVLDEVSAVDDPANGDRDGPLATFEIIKSRSARTAGRPLKEEIIMSDINKNDDDGDEFDPEEIADALEAAEEALEAAEADRNEAVGKAAALEEENDELHDEIAKANAKYEELKKSTTALVERVEKMRSGEKVEEDDLVSSVRKSLGGAELSPEVEARLTAVEKANKEADDREAIAKARTLGVGNAETLAPILQRVRKGRSTAEDATAIETLLKSLGAQLEKSNVFVQLGAGDAAADASSPIAKANAGAEEIRKANPGMSIEKARAEYWAQNPEAYAAMRSQAA